MGLDIGAGADGIEWRVSAVAVPYAEAVAEMESRVAAIRAGAAPELVWLLEHPPLYTAGASARDEDLLEPGRFSCPTAPAAAAATPITGRASALST